MHRVFINPLTLSEYQALVTNIPKYCPNAIFGVAGQTLTAIQAVAFIDVLLTAVSATATAKTGWVDARMAEEKLVTQDGAVLKAIRENILTMFSNNTTALAAFEIAPKKPRQPLSAEARTAATAKLRATRTARGTKSKKQKAAIAGNVIGVTITPVTAPTATPTATPTVNPGTTTPTGAASAAPSPATPAASNGAAPAAPAAVVVK